MRYPCFLLCLGLITALTAPAPAGIFFGKHTKPTPAERVSQLLITVKTDTNEGKRAGAAKELREFDPRAFPEIVPMLIEVLKHDPKAAVRLEAVQTLGKLHPVSQEAGLALEEAVSDSNWRVRWQARQSLQGYRKSGYRSPPKAEPTTPAIGKQSPSHKMPGFLVKPETPSAPSKNGPVIVPRETPPPPLADPLPAAPASGGAPMNVSQPAPVETPRLQKPPTRTSEEGPDLPKGN
jgi:hypothetical protein